MLVFSVGRCASYSRWPQHVRKTMSAEFGQARNNELLFGLTAELRV